MSAFSTTSYYPIDSMAPTVFGKTQRNNYIEMSLLGLMIYDHIITLDKEIEWIWTLRWRLPKIMFIFNRYVVASLILLGSIPDTIFPLPISFCSWYGNFGLWTTCLHFGATQMIMAIRLWALYGNRKLLIWSLRSLLFLALICIIVAFDSYSRNSQMFLFYKFLPGCWRDIPGRAWYPRAIILFVDGIFVILMSYKLLLYRNEMNTTITMLARDSIVYFLIVFIFHVLKLIVAIQGDLVPNFSYPTQCITILVVSRMMMNIRGLIMDDPEHTIHLQTLEFAAHTNPGSETEMAETV